MFASATDGVVTVSGSAFTLDCEDVGGQGYLDRTPTDVADPALTVYLRQGGRVGPAVLVAPDQTYNFTVTLELPDNFDGQSIEAVAEADGEIVLIANVASEAP
jgi:hypothetical protein